MDLSSTVDPLDELARYYDALMATVDYDRWLMVAMAVAELAPHDPFTHLDVACGTGLLAKRLRQHGWPTVGIDLSPAMLRAGRRGSETPPAAVADMRDLPFQNAFGYVTCLFDSVNFLIEDGALGCAFRSIRQTMTGDGILYFDIITARMVCDHFENRTWTETNNGFKSTWTSSFDRESGIAETTVRVNQRQEGLVQERIYSLADVTAALEEAGFVLLGAFDAESWKAPSKKSIRIDVVAASRSRPDLVKPLDRIAANVRSLLK